MSSFVWNFLHCRSRITACVYGSDAVRMFSTTRKPRPEEIEKQQKMDEWLKTARPYEEMPQMPMVPVLGSAWAYLPVIGKYSSKKIHEVDAIKHQLYGDIVRERFGKHEIVSCYNPEAMSIFGSYEGRYPSRGEFATIKAYRLQRKDWFKPLGLIVLEGDEWKQFRKQLQRYLVMDTCYGDYKEPIYEVAKEFVDFIESKRDLKGEVDVRQYLRQWAFESIARIALDRRFGCLDPNSPVDSDAMKMIEAVETMLDCITVLEPAAGNYPFWQHFSTPTWRKFVKVTDEFTILASSYIKEALVNYKLLDEKRPLTLLQKFLIEGQFDIPSTVTAVSDFLQAGIDTTAAAAAFMLYNLAKHPEQQEKAYQQILSILPNKEDNLVTAGVTVNPFKYISHCRHESMRLFPIARGNMRIMPRDVVICGYRIPAKTPILCVLQVPYRSEKYFENPNQFIPERWDEKNELNSINQMSIKTFTPFGVGSRACIGRFIAEQEISTMVIEVLRKYSLEYHHEDVGMHSRLVNVPDRPVRIRFVER